MARQKLETITRETDIETTDNLPNWFDVVTMQGATTRLNVNCIVNIDTDPAGVHIATIHDGRQFKIAHDDYLRLQ